MNAHPEEYVKDMNKLAERLREEPASAVELAKDLGVSKPTIYARLKRMGPMLGFYPLQDKARRGARGPASLIYSLR